ncbi:triose-phosphate isomerase [Candidatus Bipolaricaulota bacterium]
MRRRLVAGNWKMHMTPQETEAFITRFLGCRVEASSVEVLLLPPYTSLDRAARLLEGTGVGLGAQDLHFEERGAYTGAISGEMLRASGCRYVLAGHSERRHVFGDDDATVGRKLRAALSAELLPILCVGETLEDRRSGKTDDVVAAQLAAGFGGLDASDTESIAIAYEPVWAIGTGETATPEQAQEAIASIRGWLADRFDATAADVVRILYGGSVKPENAAALLAQPGIDGALVGGASLDPSAFSRIVKEASG